MTRDREKSAADASIELHELNLSFSRIAFLGVLTTNHYQLFALFLRLFDPKRVPDQVYLLLNTNLLRLGQVFRAYATPHNTRSQGMG